MGSGIGLAVFQSMAENSSNIRATFVEPVSASRVGRRRGTARKGRASEGPESDELYTVLREMPILLVEDDPPSARLVLALLRRHGADIRAVSSAEAALETLEHFMPRLLLVDLVLPMMSGLLLAQRLRQSPATASVAICAMTAFHSREAAALAAEAGCIDCIEKPIESRTFAARLVAALSKEVDHG